MGNVNRRIRFLLSAVTLLVASAVFSTAANAGVGMLEEDENLFSSSLSLSASNKEWDGNRNVLTSICKKRNASLNLGYEYGWSYFHTVFINGSLAYRRCGSNVRFGTQVVSGRSAGLGDIELGVRTRFAGNYINNAAWETGLIIPTGYDNNSPSALGRGALGLFLGLKFSSVASDRYPAKWGYSPRKWAWSAGTKFTYFFAAKGNSLGSFAALQYAFTQSDFERTGDFVEFGVKNSIGFAQGGVQQQIFINQNQSAMTNSDKTSIYLKYSHAFTNGWSGSLSIGKALFGRNAAKDITLGASASYRWRD